MKYLFILLAFAPLLAMGQSQEDTVLVFEETYQRRAVSNGKTMITIAASGDTLYNFNNII